MADRYRDQPYQDEDYGRDPYAAPQRSAESDPLAELARLIGQTDPFSTFGRDNQAPARQANFDEEATAPYEEDRATQPAWMRNVRPQPEASYGDEQRYRDDAQDYEQDRFDQSHDRRNGRVSDKYDHVLFGEPRREEHHDAPFPAARDSYRDDRYDDRHYDDDLDEEPPRRRGGMLSVFVVMLLAVVGTAAAFGYRTFIGSPRSGEPPVIKADAGPNKVMSASGDKPITDRVGAPAERVVSREEQPVDVGGKAQPRVVFPPLTQNTNPPNAASANPSSRPTGAGVGNGTVTSSGEEPRKIRTLTIRPDQSSDTASADTSAPPPPAPRATAQAATRPPAPSVAPTPAQSGGPIALTPQPSAPPVAEARPKVASISSSSGGAAGSYVQVSSQKTEADAQTSFKAIQAKYPDVLGSKSATIRRADLGDKGVFYRALVGPFSTTDEAATFCVSLKAAGGSCLVQRN